MNHDVKNKTHTIFPSEVDWEVDRPAYFVTLARDCRQIANDCGRALREARRAAGPRLTQAAYGRLAFKRDSHQDLAERLEKHARRLYQAQEAEASP